MAAPRQPSPRTLSPEIPVVSYPTPNISDLMVVQDVDTRVPGYVALNYGDPHPDQVSYPGLKLVFQTPLDSQANHMWVRRIYAKNRADQDSYNYAIKYAGSDPNFPSYIRTYTILRSDYVPLAKGSVDPLFPKAPNGNNVVLNTEEVTRYKDESDADEKSLDSLYVKVTRVYITLPGPTIYGGQVDSRYGIPILVEKQSVPAGVGPSVVQAPDGSIRSSDIDPVDTLQSTRLTSILPQLPEPQVWYGSRNVSGLPPVLVSAEIVGTEQLAFVPRFEECPDGPHPARYTRTFSFGPPSEEPQITHLLSPQPFNTVLEYTSTRTSHSTTSGSSTNSGIQSGTFSSNQTGTSNSTSSGTSSSSQTGTSTSSQTGTSSSTSSGTSTSSQTGTSSSTSSGTSSSTQTGTSNSTSSGTSSSSQMGTSSSSQMGSSSSSQMGSSSSSQMGSSSSSQMGTSSSSQTSGYSKQVSGSESSAENAPVLNGSTVKNTISDSGGTETQNTQGQSQGSSQSQSQSSSQSQSQGSSQSQSQSTAQGTSSSTAQGTSESTAQGTSSSTSQGTSSSTAQGTSSSTAQGTSSSTAQGTSESTSQGTSSSTAQGTSSSTSQGTSSSTSQGTSSGTSNSSSQYNSESISESSSKSLLSIQLPRCLRGSINLIRYLGDNGTVSVTIPATNVADLPYNSWYEIGRSSEHWKYGVWVTEKTEVKLRKV